MLLYNCEALLWDHADHHWKLELTHDAAVLVRCDWECLILAFNALHLRVVESHRETEGLLLIFKWFGPWPLERSRGQGHRGY